MKVFMMIVMVLIIIYNLVRAFVGFKYYAQEKITPFLICAILDFLTGCIMLTALRLM